MLKLIPVICITSWSFRMNGDGFGICDQSKIGEAMNFVMIYDTTFPLEERQWNPDSLDRVQLTHSITTEFMIMTSG